LNFESNYLTEDKLIINKILEFKKLESLSLNFSLNKLEYKDKKVEAIKKLKNKELNYL